VPEENGSQETVQGTDLISTGPRERLTLIYSTVPQQAQTGVTLTTYLKGVDDKLVQLKDKHAKLVEQVQKDGSGAEPTVALNAILGELKKKGEELQFQIEAMKSAKGEDQLALQTGMDQTLKELTQSYEKALAEFLG